MIFLLFIFFVSEYTALRTKIIYKKAKKGEMEDFFKKVVDNP